MKRTIIKIDEEKCTGCGLCVPNCHEGALQIIDNKARLISDLFCDGLGACIGHCPEDAITLEEREAEPYNETLVMEEMVKKGRNTILAHIQHLKAHGAHDFLNEAIQYIKKHNIDLRPDEMKDSEAHLNPKKPTPWHNNAFKMDATHEHKNGGCGGGCPGSKMIDLRDADFSEDKNTPVGETPSQLRQWPVQLHLLSPQAPYFNHADVVLAADCAAYAMGNFHDRFLKGKTLAIACPKLDTNLEVYIEKIKTMIDLAKINTLTIVRMEVPCCGGLTQIAQQAIAQASRKIPLKQAIVNSQGEVIAEEWI